MPKWNPFCRFFNTYANQIFSYLHVEHIFAGWVPISDRSCDKSHVIVRLDRVFLFFLTNEPVLNPRVLLSGTSHAAVIQAHMIMRWRKWLPRCTPTGNLLILCTVYHGNMIRAKTEYAMGSCSKENISYVQEDEALCFWNQFGCPRVFVLDHPRRASCFSRIPSAYQLTAIVPQTSVKI